MKTQSTLWLLGVTLASSLLEAKEASQPLESLEEQRKALMLSTLGKGFGPQSPRDIDDTEGKNSRTFYPAPAHTQMNLCNIHLHKNAEHKGGEFSRQAANGRGFVYSGTLDKRELRPVGGQVCPSEHGGLVPGDTIEAHYVYSSAKVEPGHTLSACLSDAIQNPQLRVEAQVYVLVSDPQALDFRRLAKYEVNKDLHQAQNIPANTGVPVTYAGSTTGPSFNKKGSPFQVTWSVRPQVAKVNIKTVAQWCEGNIFKERHAHGVRNLIVNPNLLSNIQE